VGGGGPWLHITMSAAMHMSDTVIRSAGSADNALGGECRASSIYAYTEHGAKSAGDLLIRVVGGLFQVLPQGICTTYCFGIVDAMWQDLATSVTEVVENGRCPTIRCIAM
jgi:hypothetical protein